MNCEKCKCLEKLGHICRTNVKTRNILFLSKENVRSVINILKLYSITDFKIANTVTPTEYYDSNYTYTDKRRFWNDLTSTYPLILVVYSSNPEFESLLKISFSENPSFSLPYVIVHGKEESPNLFTHYSYTDRDDYKYILNTFVDEFGMEKITDLDINKITE